MRLAEGQVRFVLADYSGGFGRNVRRQGPREIGQSDAGDASDAENCHQATQGGLRRSNCMKYMIMMFGDAGTMMEQQPREWIVEMMGFMHKLNDALTRSGELVDAQG